MTTRRSFLIGTAGLLTYSLLDMYMNHIEKYGEALIEQPKEYDATLYLNPSTNYFELGDWGDYGCISYPDPPTWADWAVNYSGFCKEEELEDYMEGQGLTLADASTPVGDKEEWLDNCATAYSSIAFNSPTANAFHYLEQLNLGPDYYNADTLDNGLLFDEYINRDWDASTVEPRSKVSVSLLQKKLLELGEPTRIMTGYSD